MIRSILSRYREEVGGVFETRQINLVLHNAIVPSHYLPAFFDFIFDIYKVNFDYELPQDIYGEFRFVYDGLRNAMLSDSDDLQLSIKNTKKVYKLIRTTKQLIAGNDLDSVINLSIIIVKLIDRYYWGEQVTVFNPYLKVGFDSWVKNISIHSDRKKRSKKTELTSRWEPKLRLENNKIKLVPPVHKVKSHYDPYKISISLYNENKLIYLCEQPDIKEIIGGYKQMNMVFQHFVFEYFNQEHKELDVTAPKMKWEDDKNRENTIIRFLPEMQTDIVLSKNEKRLIIDTK